MASSQHTPHILFFGAGAVGCGIGAMLAHRGFQVTLVGRERLMDPIAQGGLRVKGIWGHHRLPPGRINAVTAVEQAPAPVDTVFVTTKSWDTAAAAAALLPLAKDGLTIISLQNGVGNAQLLAAELPQAAVIAGMIITGFEWDEPGVVRVTVEADSVKLGALPGSGAEEHARRAAAWLGQAGIAVEAVSDIERHQWSKLLYNAALNPLGALLRSPYGALTAPEPWQIIERIIGEAFTVLAAAKIEVFWDEAKAYLEHLRSVQIPRTKSHYPSMLRDLERGRPTEIDAINGRIVSLGQEHGVAVPVNETLVRLIRAAAAQRRLDDAH